jgi:hypothetical protein
MSSFLFPVVGYAMRRAVGVPGAACWMLLKVRLLLLAVDS